MAENVGTMIADVQDETHWPSETTAIIRHMKAALRHYQRRRFYFSEKADTFATVAGQHTYIRSEYPSDLLEIDSIRAVIGGGETVLNRIGLIEMREKQANSTADREGPQYFSWLGDSLILFPTPGGAYTVKVDYLFDATRNATDGVEIDGTVLTHTNDYFTRGAEILRTRIIYSLGLGRAQDPQLSISMKTLNAEAEQSLEFETHQRKFGSSMQIRPHF